MDVLVADVYYLKVCWTLHVLNPSRRGEKRGGEDPVQVAEFAAAVRDMLNDGAVKSMNDILVLQDDFSLNRPRWRFKELLHNLIPEVELTKPKNPREAEILHFGEARRIAMVNQQNQEQRKFTVLLHAAKILRDEIRLQKSWKLGDEVE